MATVPLEREGWRHFKHRGFEEAKRAANAEGARRDVFRRRAARNFDKAADGVPQNSPNAGKDKLENLLNAVKCEPDEDEREILLEKTDLLVKEIEIGALPFSSDDMLIPKAKKLIQGETPRFEEVLGLKIRSAIRVAEQADETRGRPASLVRRELELEKMPDPMKAELPMYPHG